MSQVSQAIRKHHRVLMATIEAYVKALVEERSDADPKGLARYLKDELLPHAIGEEQHLYPTIEPLIQTHGQATATMSVDHAFIEDTIHQIEAVVKRLKDAGQEQNPDLRRKLQHLALQLEAILRLHLEKEERVYLPLFEQHLSEEEQQRVLDGMHTAYEHKEALAMRVKTELDVRQIPPVQRHPLIFRTFDGLQPNEAFILVNDHDPKPLYYQFLHERQGQFNWEYLEQGPEVWRVRIGKIGGGK